MDRMVNNPPTAKIAGPIAAAQNLVVLCVSESENTGKRIESHLRNAGHPVRVGWVTDLEDLQEALSRGAPDLLICSEALEEAPFNAVVELCGKLCPDMPVLLLGTAHSQEETVAALAAGARDQVSAEDLRSLRHLELVVMREFLAHHHLRELRNTRLRLANFESRHLQLLAGTNDAVAHIQEGILSHVNPAFAQMLGHSNPQDLTGLPLMDLIAPDYVPKAKEYLKQLNKGRLDDKPMETQLRKADGSTITIQARLTRGNVDGENFIEMLVRAETPAAALPAAAAPPAPPAVAVSGRTAFLDALDAAVKGSQSGVRAACFIVIDGFAALEDRLGFRDVEETVIKAGDWVQQRLTAQDRLFRFSTGEFAAVLERNAVSEIEHLCEGLCRDINGHIFSTHGHEATLSLTVTAYPLAGGENPLAVINELGRESRKISAKGGKQFLVIGPTAKSSAAEREEARRAAQVKRAIEENRLKLAYQSIASLEGDTRQHFDVLVRMVDESGKEQHAGEFIPAAEKFGLMRLIDRWVTGRVLKLLAKRDGAKETSSLFVKLSEETLKDAENYLAWLTEQVKERKLKPEELVIEIQELKLQNHIRKAKTLTKGLQELGASVAIEHFGIGSNTVQLLEHIPASYYKFHPNFTHQFNDKEIQRKMSQLMDIAKQRGVKTIVCHVEDANVMARLWQMGVNYIQGYHVQEPEVVLLSTDLFSRTVN